MAEKSYKYVIIGGGVSAVSYKLAFLYKYFGINYSVFFQ